MEKDQRDREIKSLVVELFSYAKYWREQVDPRLKEFFQAERQNPFCGEEFGREVLEKIEELTLRGGKRQRVAFVAATTSLLGKDVTDEQVKRAIVDSAMGVEILQTHLLIHDDIIDEAPLRRGGKTIHRVYTEEFPRRSYRGDPKKYGDSVALLAGDLAIYFACQPIITSEALSPEGKIKILNILIRSGIDTFYGQLLDLLRDVRGSTTEEEILKLAFIKAGRSSAEAPMHIGAVLAEKDSPDVLAKLSAYAIPTSIAAQLQDDILGMFGKEEILGKSPLSDLAEGKQTLLILETHKRANPSEKRTLEILVGKRDITQEEANQVREIVIATGALDYVRETARKFVNQAQSALDAWGADWGVKEKHFFWAVTEAAVAREY
ncbi:MAG: geranylgeranyl diphosphate synthase, type I [Microgenomates group bacterium LiPW_16]|nr:MAG: geranylgeranyl diphosphate synthase, type I [Microgenomates group bacterium LiPW_16]